MLLERATGTRLDVLLEERIFAPLGMGDTGFHVPAASRDGFTVVYRGFDVGDDLDGDRSRPLAFRSGAAGPVSTAADLLAFDRALLDPGLLLAGPTLEAMRVNQLTPAHRIGTELFLPASRGWSLGRGVVLPRDTPPACRAASAGRAD